MKIKSPKKKSLAPTATKLGQRYTTEELVDALAVSAIRDNYHAEEVISFVAKRLLNHSGKAREES